MKIMHRNEVSAGARDPAHPVVRFIFLCHALTVPRVHETLARGHDV